MIAKVLHRLREARDRGPLPLYVSRRLTNSDEFIAWAKEQGFEKVTEPKDLHVTVLYSKKPMDWRKAPADKKSVTVSGRARKVMPLGDEGAVVLKFDAPALASRHDLFVSKGGSHDYDSYKPHVTITYDGKGVDLKKVQPFKGDLVFGPEIFKVIDREWKPDEN